MLYAIVGILVIILDQGVKYWVTSNLLVGSVTQTLIPGIISLIRLHNDGAAFSFLAGGGARIYFIILTVVFTVAVIIALATNFINGSFGRWCLVLVTAGGLSNCLDRVLYGYVVDMFKLDILPEFAVFNVADIFITVFALLFIVYIIFGNEDNKANEDEFDELDDEDADREPLRLGLKKNRKAVDPDDFDRAERPARERAAEAKAKKYRADDDEDEVASPRFGFGKQRAAAPADAAPRKTAASAASAAVGAAAGAPRQGANRPAAKRPVEDNSPAARRERALEGFGPKPSAASQVQQRNKAQKTRYEEDYEQYKAAHPELNERPARKSATKPAAPTYDTTDPFAEWERANARVESGRAMGATARAMGVEPAAAKSAPADTAAPTRNAAPAPAKPAAPKPVAAPAPKAAEPSDDFSLDDILNEFK